MSNGNTFMMGEKDKDALKTDDLETPFIVEPTDTGVLVYSTKEGPLRLTHREAQALAAILTDSAQSK